MKTMWNTEFFQKHSAGALQYALREVEGQALEGFRQAVEQCESPLEAAFAAWWIALGHAHDWMNMALEHQRIVDSERRRWRVDVVVAPTTFGLYGRLSGHADCPKIAVELDGHEFHERTKEQVTQRNQRDRALSAAGWTVWHISGSEFHSNPTRVVRDIYSRADRVMSRQLWVLGFVGTDAPPATLAAKGNG